MPITYDINATLPNELWQNFAHTNVTSHWEMDAFYQGYVKNILNVYAISMNLSWM